MPETSYTPNPKAAEAPLSREFDCDCPPGSGTGGIENVSQQVVGAGTNYTLTGTFANVVFGTTSPTVILPSAGTYLVMASLVYQADAAGAADLAQARLQNTTDGLTIGHAGVAFNAGFNSNFAEAAVMGIVTITAAKTVTLQANNGTAARGIIFAANTLLAWVKLA